MPKRRIEAETIAPDDIQPIDNQVPKDTVQEEDANHVQGELEKARDELKQMFLRNPHLKVSEPNDQLKIIDIMTPDQIEIMKHSVRSQLHGILDKGFSTKLMSKISRFVPFVDTDQLIKDLEDDTHFQNVWNSFIGMRVINFPEELKIALVYGVHIINNLKLESSTKKHNASSSPPLSDVNMREIELRENDPNYELAS